MNIIYYYTKIYNDHSLLDPLVIYGPRRTPLFPLLIESHTYYIGMYGWSYIELLVQRCVVRGKRERERNRFKGGVPKNYLILHAYSNFSFI